MVKERIHGRKNYPTDELGPDNFLNDDNVKDIMNKLETLKFEAEEYESKE